MHRRLRSRPVLVLSAACAAAAVFVVCGLRGVGLEGRAARWSGYVTLGVLCLAWVLPVARWRGGPGETPPFFRRMHEWMGAVFLGAVVLHGARVQSALTAALAATAVGGAVVGAFPPERFQAPAPWYARGWWVAHLVLGTLVSALAAIHVYAVLAY